MKQFMSVPEAAEELGVSEQTLERALAAGDLKPVGGLTISGKKVRRQIISRESLVAWVEGPKESRA